MGKRKNSQSKLSSRSNNVAAAYLRVSTKTQEEKGFSLEVQKERSIIYAKENGLILTEDMIFVESRPASKTYNDDLDSEVNGIHETLKYRPALSRIIELAGDKKITHLIVYTRDRLTRNIQDYITLKAFFARKGVKVHYSRPGELANTEDNKINNFLDLILASVAELEANTIGIRVKGGNRSCIKNSYWAGGKAPLGYFLEQVPNSKKNTTLKVVEFEQKMIKDIFDYYIVYGYGYRKISKLMNERYKFITWTKSKIESILKNETYTGCIAWDRRGGRRYPGKHEEYDKSPFIKDASIIAKDQWHQAVDLRQKKLELKDAKYFSSPFLLKGKLVCGICGSPMECKNYGKGKKSVYRCPSINEKGISESIVEKELIEKCFIDKLNSLFVTKDIDLYWNLYKEQMEKQRKENNDILLTLDNNLNEIREIKSDLKRILSESTEEPIRERLLEQGVILNKKDIAFKTHIEEIRNKDCCHFRDKNEFSAAVNKVFERFNCFSQNQKRMLVEILVDNIFINSNGDSPGDIGLRIILNPPKFI